jgi:hypothetical protein
MPDTFFAAVAHANSVRIGLTDFTIKHKIIHHNASGDNAMSISVTGKQIRIVQMILVVANGVTVQPCSGIGGTATAISGSYQLDANGGMVLPFNEHGWFADTVAGEDLNLKTSGGVYMDGSFKYIEI